MLQPIGLPLRKVVKDHPKLEALDPPHGCLFDDQRLWGGWELDPHSQSLTSDNRIFAKDPTAHSG